MLKKWLTYWYRPLQAQNYTKKCRNGNYIWRLRNIRKEKNESYSFEFVYEIQDISSFGNRINYILYYIISYLRSKHLFLRSKHLFFLNLNNLAFQRRVSCYMGALFYLPRITLHTTKKGFRTFISYYCKFVFLSFFRV